MWKNKRISCCCCHMATATHIGNNTNTFTFQAISISVALYTWIHRVFCGFVSWIASVYNTTINVFACICVFERERACSRTRKSSFWVKFWLFFSLSPEFRKQLILVTSCSRVINFHAASHHTRSHQCACCDGTIRVPKHTNALHANIQVSNG